MSKIPPKLMVKLVEGILENDERAYTELSLFHAPSECGEIIFDRTRRDLRRALMDGGYTAEEFDILTQRPEFEGAWSYGGLMAYLENPPWRDHA